MLDQHFYVYRLVDPRDDATFYIGKGKGDRMHQHAADARAGRCHNRPKTERINEIHAAGLEVRCEVERANLDEVSAYALEEELISSTKGLTNIAGGLVVDPAAVARKEAEARLRFWERVKPRRKKELVEMLLTVARSGSTHPKAQEWIGSAAHLAVEAFCPSPPPREDVEGRMRALGGLIGEVYGVPAAHAP